MRPERLEVEGFTAFREPTVVDFEGADLFAFAGPTGAGKSSLIDAMTFALYGSIPRLDKKAVAPVISQGLLQARVRLDFTVDGVGVHRGAGRAGGGAGGDDQGGPARASGRRRLPPRRWPATPRP